MDDLHSRLAAAGVPLFADPAVPEAPLDARGLADLIVEVLGEGSASLAVALPCLLVAQSPSAAAAVRQAAERVPVASRKRLGLLHLMARCLASSRGPDIEHRFGRRIALPAWEGEPVGLPDPAERFGASCIREARDEEIHPETAGMAGDAERTFDQWLRILAVESGRS